MTKDLAEKNFFNYIFHFLAARRITYTHMWPDRMGWILRAMGFSIFWQPSQPIKMTKNLPYWHLNLTSAVISFYVSSEIFPLFSNDLAIALSLMSFPCPPLSSLLLWSFVDGWLTAGLLRQLLAIPCSFGPSMDNGGQRSRGNKAVNNKCGQYVSEDAQSGTTIWRAWLCV